MSVKYILLGGLMFSCSHGYEIKSQLTQKKCSVNSALMTVSSTRL